VEKPGRKVAYKLLRPDFFVVVGEASGSAFYRRMAVTEHEGAKVLTGYLLVYPLAAKATFDPITIAIANSMDVTGAAAPEAPPAVASTPQAAPPPAAGAVAKTPALAATGIAVAPGLVLTSIPSGACERPRVGARSAKVLRRAEPGSKAAGLTLLEVAGLSAPA